MNFLNHIEIVEFNRTNFTPFKSLIQNKQIIAMVKTPKIKNISRIKDSLGFLSWSSSGSTDTNAIFKKPPAENGNIQSDVAWLASIASIHMAKHAPVIPVAAVNIWALAASYL